MAVDLETLEIKIEASASNATKSLDNLASSLKNVKSALSNLNGKEKHVEKVGEKAAEAEQKVSEAAKETKDLNEQQNKASSSGKKFSFSLANITKSAGKVQSGISSIFSGFKNGDAASIFGGISSFKSAFEGASTSGKGIGETAAAGAKKAADEMKAAGEEATDAGDAASASAGGWEAVAAVLIMNVAKGAIKVWWAFQKLKFRVVTAPFKWMAEQATNAIAKVTQLFAALKRIAMYRLLRTAIKEIGEGFSTGVEDAYYFSQVTGGQLSKSLDLIATEFLYLKNSIGAAVAPLINALAPAVEFVVDKFVALLNVVNQFLSALGIGGKWIKAIKFPTKYGDALDNANSSAKELKRTILGIDEINPLNGDNSSGKGKSGFTAADYSQMFEYETIDPQIADFAAQIKAMIERGAWGELGSLLGGKINKFLQDADARVNWDGGAGEKIKEKLGNITEAINGFLNTFNGEYLGQLVGDAIQTFFNSISFLDEDLDSTALADDISGFINGALQRIDGQKIGETIHNVVTTTIGVLRNAIRGVDSGLLAEDAAGFISGLNITDIISRANSLFGDLGKAIEPAVEAMISSIWEDAKGFISQKFSEIGAFIEYKVKSAWNDFINDLIEMAQQSPLTSLLVPSLQKGLVDLGDTAIGSAANTASDIYEFVGGVFSGFNSVFKKGGEENANAYGTSFDKSLNSHSGAGSSFANNVNKNVDGSGNGKTQGGGFVGGYSGMLMPAKIGSGFGIGVSGNVKKEADGSKDGENYATGYSKKLSLLDVITGAAANFGKKVKELVTGNANGEKDGENYNSGYTGKMKVLGVIAGAAANFGKKVKELVTGNANGEKDGEKYNSDYSKKLQETKNPIDAARAFGKTVRDYVSNNAKGAKMGETYNADYSHNLEQTEKPIAAARAFGKTVRDYVGNNAKGAKMGETYNADYSNNLKQTEKPIAAARAFGKTIRDYVGNNAKGAKMGETYNADYSNKLQETTNPLAAATAFGNTITKGITKIGNKDRGTEDAVTYKSDMAKNFENSITPGGVSQYASKITSGITTTGGKSRGAAASNTVTSDFNTQIANAAAGGGAFGGKVKTNVETGINATGIASNVKTALSNNLPSTTTIGENFGTAVGKNIATKMKSGFNNNFSGLVGSDSSNNKYNVMTITAKAQGGVLDYPGQLFIANEAGPELVGNIGRKTAVANTTQMVDAMAQGVYQANAEGNMLMRQLIQYAAEIAAKEYSSGGEVTVESITSAMARNNRRLGKTTVGVY